MSKTGAFLDAHPFIDNDTLRKLCGVRYPGSHTRLSIVRGAFCTDVPLLRLFPSLLLLLCEERFECREQCFGR